MHKFDIGSQKVYQRMFENSPNNDLVGMYTYYCVYEIMINNIRPEYETVDVLEQIFLKRLDSLLAYGLSYLYLEQGIITLQSDNILGKAIEKMEEEDILLPIFKNKKDKRFNLPYMEKNQPFIYRCVPNKNVSLYYKANDDVEFTRCPMKHFYFGLYLAKITHFYGERIVYYFCEEMETGSIVTKEYSVENNRIFLNEESEDVFFHINNGLIYEQMFKYDQVEAIITSSLQKYRTVRGGIL